MLNGVYHGNLNLKSCFVDKDHAIGVVTVKLANFKCKAENSVLMSQVEDWNAIGGMILEILMRVYNCNASFEVSLLNDLGEFLQTLPPDVPIHDVKMKTLDHVFFWDKYKRTSFFVFGILELLSNNHFIQRVKELDFLPENWNSDDHDGVLTALDTKFQNGRQGYVVFVSAAYTHEEELKDNGKIRPEVKVDDIISKKHPRLCLELVKIVRELGFNV